MAISTIKISDTAEWAARMSFGRRSNIGNNLQPALTNANIIAQTILGPPFSWWWNSQELAFTCNPTAATSAITNVAITSNVLTLTTTNSWVKNNVLIVSGLTTSTFLNGQILVVLSATSSIITAAFVHPDVANADTGTLTAASTQDYTVSAPNFTHVEHASVQDISQTPAKWYELPVKDNLALDSIVGRPQFLNPHTEDGNGNVTFRVMPGPKLAYPVSIHVQLAPPLFTSMNQTWSPLPDFMSYVFNWGFLALQWIFADDPRAGFANSKFTAGLLARAEGLTEEQRNIFLNNWMALTGMQQQQSQQGTQARSV